MEPIKQLLDFLQQRLRDQLSSSEMSALEDTVQQLFSRFELVSKQDYAAQMAVLETLQAQIADLEQRLNNLEQP